MASHDITFNEHGERTKCVRIEDDETILHGAEDAGLGLPYGCLTGACATCTGRLTAGEIAYQRPPRALKEDQKEEGYVLLCVAEPRSDCHIDVGPRIQAELVSNPWKQHEETTDSTTQEDG